MEPFLEEIVSLIESAYLTLSRELDHELRWRVPLIVYKTHGEFQQTNITLSELPEGVACFRRADPEPDGPADRPMPPDKLYQLIAHELVHIFQYSMFFEGYLGRALRSNIPTWLMEGMASYFAKDEDNLDRMAIRDAVVNNILPPIQALNVVTFLTYRYGHADLRLHRAGARRGGRTQLPVRVPQGPVDRGNLAKAIKEVVRLRHRRVQPTLQSLPAQEVFPRAAGEKIARRLRHGGRRPETGRCSRFAPSLSPSGELIAVAVGARRWSST